MDGLILGIVLVRYYDGRGWSSLPTVYNWLGLVEKVKPSKHMYSS